MAGVGFTDGDKGDITISSSGTVLTIDNDAVTYAKIQNVSATDRLLGRSSAGAGDVEELDAATARTVLSVQPTASPAFTGAATFENTGNVVPLTVTNTGTANSFVVNDASGDTSPFVIDASGNVGIGLGGAPNAKVQVNLGDVAPAASGDMNTGVVFQTNGASRAINIGTNNTGGYSWINAAFANNSGVADNLHLMTGATTRLTISSTGTATFAGQVLVTAGSVSACSVAPSGDANTGLYFPAADVAAIVTNGTERVRVDASGNVGIGTTSAAGRLHAYNGADATTAVLIGEVSGAFSNAADMSLRRGGTELGRVSADYFDGMNFLVTSGSGNAAVQRMRINTGGELMIGYTTDQGGYLLQVNSQIYATNATVATSDARFKTRVESLTDATSVIESLRPVAFDFIPQSDRNFAAERQVGLIAQEAQAALEGTDYADSVVAQCGDHLGLAYEKLVPVLIKALQESNARIAALEERLNHA
jgi:hypothetical protein